MSPRIYLDHNASAPLLEEAREAVLSTLDLANAASVHREGQAARRVVEIARDDVAKLVGADRDQVFFTSGATEAANLLLQPHWQIGERRLEVAEVAVLPTDHPATRLGGRFPSRQVTYLPVDRDGVIDLGELERWLERRSGPAMLAIGLVNGETGVVQPAREIAARLAGHGDVLFLLDAVQAAGRIPLEVGSTGADTLLLSGQKIGAMKGSGAFVLSGRAKPNPALRGGGQEKGLRPGTQAVSAIASFGAAARVAAGTATDAEVLAELRRHVVGRLAEAIPDATILGEGAPNAGNTVLIAHPRLRAQTAQMALDLAGIAVSSGSACSSGKVEESEVVRALVAAGAKAEPGQGAIRVSFGHRTRPEELDSFLSAYGRLINRERPTEMAAA